MLIYFVFVLALFNMTSVSAARVLLALYALNLGAQPLAVGFLAATFSAFPTVLSWSTGRFADRFGARWPLLFGSAGGACGMLVPYFIPSLPALYVAAAMNGLSFTFYNVAMQNLVGLMSKPEDRAVNYGNFSLVMAAATFVAPLLAGFSIDHSGYSAACLYVVVLSFVPAMMLALRGGLLPGGTRDGAPQGSIRDLLADPGLWRVLVSSSLVVGGVDLYLFYLPIYGHGIGLSASVIGIVLATFAVASLLVRLVMASLIARLNEEKLLAYSFYLGAVSLAALPFFKSAVVLGVVSFIFGLSMGCGQPITMMLAFSGSAKGRSGEALGVRVTVNHFTRGSVPVLFGSIGSAFGAFAVYWGSALLLGAGALYTHRDRSLSGRRAK